MDEWNFFESLNGHILWPSGRIVPIVAPEGRTGAFNFNARGLLMYLCAEGISRRSEILGVVALQQMAIGWHDRKSIPGARYVPEQLSFFVIAA